jgi:pimeloyl-ACP methyl ester carboxylesterase
MRLVFFRPPPRPAPILRVMADAAVRSRATHEKIFADLFSDGTGGLEPLLPGIAAPTLVVWGEEDRVVDPSSVPIFTSAIPHAESSVFEACGHALPLECPELLGRRYAAFLETLRRSPAQTGR